MNPSTNRHVSMKANCDGKEQIFSNFILNLGNKSTFSEFTTHLSKQIKSAPDSPDYEFTFIKIKYLDGKYLEINEENYQAIREYVLRCQDKILLRAVAQGKESQYAAKRTSIEPSHSDENHPTNRNPVEVRRAGTPPKRAVCSPLRSNTRATPEHSETSTPRHGAPSPLRTRPQSPSARRSSIVRPASPHTPMRPIRTKTPTKSTSRVSTSAVKNRSSIKIKRDRTSPKCSPLKLDSSLEGSADADDDQCKGNENPFDSLVNDHRESEVIAPQEIQSVASVTSPVVAHVSQEPSEIAYEESTGEAETGPIDDNSEHEPRHSIFINFTEEYDEEPDMGNNIWRDSMGCCLDEIRNFKMSSDDQDAEDEEDDDLSSGVKRLRFDDEEDQDHENEHDQEEGDDHQDAQEQETQSEQTDPSPSAPASALLSSSEVFDETITPTATPSKAPRPRAASTTKKRPSRITAETASSAAKAKRPSRASVTAPFTPKAPTPVFSRKSSRSHSTAADGDNQTVMTAESPTDKIPSYARPRETAATKIAPDTAPLKITEQQWQNSLRKAEAPKRSDRRQPTARERARQYDATMLRAMRQDTKEMMPDGRPSVDTMAAQWEFMRDQFLGSNENLEWMMTAKQGGEKAYKLAYRKFQLAEDQYYKALCDIDIIEGKLRLLSGPDAHFLKTLKCIADCEDTLRVNPLHAEMCEIVSKNQSQLMDSLKGDMRGLCCKDLETHLKQLIDFTDCSKASKKAKFILQHAYPAEITQLKDRLRVANVASNESLGEMEKWGTRYKETSQYSIVLAEEDMEWMDVNSEDNIKALETMRSFLPMNISELSVVELQEIVKRNYQCLYPQELAMELKSNKLLHWIITHPQDITTMNFLNGDARQYFVNLEVLDVVEMRAIRMMLPDKFELDSDGKKAEWRERFIQRLKQLVSQEKEESVKGGWDPESGKRIMVRLPGLKDELKRRSFYFYKPWKVLCQRLSQYEEKERIVLKKQEVLKQAEEMEKELRQEYDTILEEMRDPSFKILYGAEKLNLAKESAKREWKGAEGRVNEVRRDIQRLVNSIKSNPISKTQFIEFMKEQDALLAMPVPVPMSAAPPVPSENASLTETDTSTADVSPSADVSAALTTEEGEVNQVKVVDWRESDVPIPINGPFDRNPEIKRIERSAAKFESAEQEAERRKAELTNLSGSSVSQEISEPQESSSVSAVSEETAEGIAQDPTAPVEEGSLDLSSTSATATAAEDNSSAASAAVQVIVGPRVSRRVSINPELAKCLNGMFTGGGSVPQGAQASPMARRESKKETPSTASVGSEDTNASASATATPSKPIRSKNLMRLLQIEDPAAPPKPPAHPLFGRGGGLGGPAGAGGLSFLDQIKNARKNTPA